MESTWNNTLISDNTVATESANSVESRILRPHSSCTQQQHFNLGFCPCLFQVLRGFPLQDVLAKFQGTWHLTPLHSECSDCSKTLVKLEQDVLPIGEYHLSRPLSESCRQQYSLLTFWPQLMLKGWAFYSRKNVASAHTDCLYSSTGLLLRIWQELLMVQVCQLFLAVCPYLATCWRESAREPCRGS